MMGCMQELSEKCTIVTSGEKEWLEWRLRFLRHRAASMWSEGHTGDTSLPGACGRSSGVYGKNGGGFWKGDGYVAGV